MISHGEARNERSADVRNRDHRGPNGSGKSTLAPLLLSEAFDIRIYVNADDIAREIAGDDLQSAAIEAGRIVHARLDQPREERADVAIETTLSGRALRRTVDRLLRSGYDVHCVPVAAFSGPRGAEGSNQGAPGGHDVPEADIRRRIHRSVSNFEHVYRRLVSYWRVYDARVPPGAHGPRLVARGGKDPGLDLDVRAWNELQAQANSREVTDA